MSTPSIIKSRILAKKATFSASKKQNMFIPLIAPSLPMNHQMNSLKVPQEYRSSIVGAAKKYKIGANFLTAVLKQENPKFDPKFINPIAQDTGLGQHIPSTVDYIKQHHNSTYNPLEPKQNIEATAWYLNDVRKRIGSENISDMIKAYHVGVTGFFNPKKQKEADKYIQDVQRWQMK